MILVDTYKPFVSWVVHHFVCNNKKNKEGKDNPPHPNPTNPIPLQYIYIYIDICVEGNGIYQQYWVENYMVHLGWKFEYLLKNY